MRWMLIAILLMGLLPVSRLRAQPIMDARKHAVHASPRVVLLDSGAGGEIALAVHLQGLAEVTTAALPAAARRGPSAQQQARYEAHARQMLSQHEAIAVLWLDKTPHALRIYLVAPNSNKLWARRLSLRAGHEEAVAEQAGLIARWAVQALIEGQRFAVDTLFDSPPVNEVQPEANITTESSIAPAPPTSAPQDASIDTASVPVATSARPWRAGPTLGYTTTHFADEVAWQHGLTLGAEWFISDWVFVGGGYTFTGATRVSTADVELEVQRHPLTVSSGVRFGQRMGFRAEATLTLDYLSRRTRATRGGLRATTGKTHIGAAPGFRAGLDWGLGERMRLSLLAGADVFLNRFEYIIGSSNADPVLQPSLVRPRLEAFWAVDIWQ